MPKSNIKIDVQVEADRLNRMLTLTEKATGKGMEKVVSEAAVVFTQSAAKNTPPAAGKQHLPASWTTKAGNVVFRDKRQLQTLQGRGNDIMGYKVKVRGKSKRFYFSDFGSRYEAKMAAEKYLPINYRGIGRMGWWASLGKLGKPMPSYGEGSGVAGKIPEINSLAKGSTSHGVYIDLVNRVKNISSYGAYAAHQALRATNNRLKWSLKNLGVDIERAWRA